MVNVFPLLFHDMQAIRRELQKMTYNTGVSTLLLVYQLKKILVIKPFKNKKHVIKDNLLHVCCFFNMPQHDVIYTRHFCDNATFICLGFNSKFALSTTLTLPTSCQKVDHCALVQSIKILV